MVQNMGLKLAFEAVQFAYDNEERFISEFIGISDDYEIDTCHISGTTIFVVLFNTVNGSRIHCNVVKMDKYIEWVDSLTSEGDK